MQKVVAVCLLPCAELRRPLVAPTLSSETKATVSQRVPCSASLAVSSSESPCQDGQVETGA